MDTGKEIRLNVAASGALTPAGQFEVDAITVGEGNGWYFSESCLKQSLPLWEGVSCFIDHSASPGEPRSVRDLAGVFTGPRWCESSLGIRLVLVTNGPAGRLVEQLGRQILSSQQRDKGIGMLGPRDGGQLPPAGSPYPLRGQPGGESSALPALPAGFSADVIFTARGRQVERIVRVVSLDLVYRPARGGGFVRALNTIISDQCCRGRQPVISKEISENGHEEGGGWMSDAGGEQKIEPQNLRGQMQQDAQAARALLNAQQEGERLAAEAEATRSVRKQMCQYMLESGLAAAKLPGPMTEHLRAQFAGRVFEPGELSSAVEDARKLVSELTGAGVVAGPAARVQGMFSSEDQLQAAVDDLLGAPRDKGAESLKAARLSGIKELYMLLTGDRDLYGGYYGDRVQLATTANFTGLVKNAMNKIVANQWQQLGAAGYDWWRRIVQVEHFDTLNQVTGVLVGTVGSLPAVAEGGEYTELKIGDSPEVASFQKYGGYIPLTLELIDRDDTRKLRLYPRELAKAGLRKISGLVAAVFTDNSGVGPTLADGGALFNSTAVTTSGGHKNLLATALGTAAWEAVKQAMYVQPMLVTNETGYIGTGARQAIKPRFLLVPVELELAAKKILYGDWENASNIHADNLQRQRDGDVIVVPEWTDATDWAAAADPAILPGILVGERFGLMPEIFIAGDELSPAVFMNDEHRMKVRHFVAVLVQDFRALHKSNI